MPHIPESIWGAVGIGVSMLLMVVFNLEHPPASALSLGIIIEGLVILTVFIIADFFLGVRKLLKNWLIDLV